MAAGDRACRDALASLSRNPRRPVAVDHHTTIHQLGEGGVQAACSCGWRSPVFGADKTTGTMDPLQRATEAGDLHEWEMSLP